MNIITKTGLIATLVTLAACGTGEANKDDATSAGGSENVAKTETPPQASQTGETHSATGTVQSISGNQVTISHDEIKSLGWPAMQMSFTASDSGLLNNIKAGDRVSFSFRKTDSASTLVSITKQ